MEARVTALENFAIETRDQLTRIETRLDTFATKEDLHRELHALSMRLIGFGVGAGSALVGIVYWIARNIH
ncbi:hypothetical protein G3I67_10465 [Orrella sp. NBD-18]|uniref:Uncharacterized protein n=1 Tax=Sheuella amnicola TaxID=2707330 RepID=A0A6B2QYH6_9BURK|nr:hypothetical protein [Sheuella amnicola]NDY83656.1 hypothetical protein [Sheuella amnicola]HBI82440.1 hypothetical protein [Alcaligenaceae bacterium]